MPKIFVGYGYKKNSSFSNGAYVMVKGKVCLNDFVLFYLPNGTLKLLTVSSCCYYSLDKESAVYFKVE